MGYVVIRALVAAYRSKGQSQRLSRSEQDLKISLATSEDLGHAKTWRMKGSGLRNQDADGPDSMEEQLLVSHDTIQLEQPLPEKLFFLATGEGCATVEVRLPGSRPSNK